MGNEKSSTKNKADTTTQKKPSKQEVNDKEQQPGAKKTVEKNKDEEKQLYDKTTLDVAFVLDCTGSMNSYIQSCKDNIISISTKISKEVENCDVQFALVSYRDIPPQDRTFVTKKLDFTPIPFKIQIELEHISATGGGDAPEALTSALFDCYKNLSWRPKSIKIIIVITDAPPHGLETHVTDGFPKGDPDTFNTTDDKEGDEKESGVKTYLNVIEIIQAIRNDLKAAIYSVACEPDLSCDNDFANDFMQYIAEYTKGKFLPLSSAKLLPDVIVGSVKQQINLDNLTNKLDEEIKKIKEEHGDDISAEELNKIIMQKWKNEGVKKKEISIGTLYRNKRSRENIELLMNEQKTKSLRDFKKNCKRFARMKRTDFRHLDKNKNKNKTKNIKLTRDISCSESDGSEMYSENASESESDSESEGSEDSPKPIRKKAVKKNKKKVLFTEAVRVEMKEEERPGLFGGFGGEDEDEDDDSDSCASQCVYSRSCSLSDGDMYNVMERLNIKSTK